MSSPPDSATRPRRGWRSIRKCWPRISSRSSIVISSFCSADNVARQLFYPRDHVQDRLLRPWAVGEDVEFALHLRAGAGRSKREDGLAGHPDGSHAVLRLLATGPWLDLWLHHQNPTLHGSGSDLLSNHAETR